MWQTVTFELSPDGWRVWLVGGSLDLVKPYLSQRGKFIIVCAYFKRQLRAGRFCEFPHRYIDFVNSYERKDK
jgi:hypothetical protein